MKNIRLLYVPLLVFAFFSLVSCNKRQTDSPKVERPDTTTQLPKMLVRPQLKDFVEPNLNIDAEIIAYDMAWQKAEPSVAAKKLAGAIEVLLGDEKYGKPFGYELLKPAIDGKEAGNWVRIEGTPIMVRYQSEYDEIRIIHEERDIINDMSADIGIARIQEAAEGYLKKLGELGIVDPQLYASAIMQLGYKMAGDGSVKEDPKPGRIVEYRITFRPRLNGIELTNAGVRLGIMGSGQLANLRLGGVTPKGEWLDGKLKSTVEKSARKIRITTKDLMSRFYNSKLRDKETEIQLAWSKVIYAMPDNISESTVEPKLTISYTEHRKIEGQDVASRRKMISYSLTDPEAVPYEYDPPPLKHEGDTPTRR